MNTWHLYSTHRDLFVVSKCAAVLTWSDAELSHGRIAQDLGDLVVDVATEQERRIVVVVGPSTDAIYQAGASPVPVLVNVSNLSTQHGQQLRYPSAFALRPLNRPLRYAGFCSTRLRTD